MFLRILDLIISFTLFLILSPIILVIGILIFFQDFKNPIFSSTRVGKNKKKFKLYKFRTMVVNNEINLIRTTRKNDPRITYIGKWVRSYKLDEIIQLWNVIKNDMTIVGPRPNVEEEIKFYNNKDLKLLNYKPGLTDFASIWFINLEDRLSTNKSNDVNLEY